MRLGWIMRDTMIGFYDYTVILTYISLASSILGMISACYARIGWAIFFLGMSGLLDTFDGKVARTKKNRTEDQKRFGIQIDSLCDIVCFGVCPVIICWFSGMPGTVGSCNFGFLLSGGIDSSGIL